MHNRFFSGFKSGASLSFWPPLSAGVGSLEHTAVDTCQRELGSASVVGFVLGTSVWEHGTRGNHATSSPLVLQLQRCL